MGYSARYHAVSLAAVFLALAVGILIGVGFGSDIVSGTADDLERSLAADLDEQRARNDALEAELEAERAFGRQVFPTVVSGTLAEREVAVVGIGGLGPEVTSDVESAVDAAGASLEQVAVVRAPPDLAALASTRRGQQAREIARGDEEELERFGEQAGRTLVSGGHGFDKLRRSLLSRYSGSPESIDGVVVVRQRPDDLEPADEASTDALERGLLAGLRSRAEAVGAERTDADPSSIELFERSGLASVDDIDLTAGRVALVFALDGAAGSFGVKGTADGLLPDLLPSTGGGIHPAPARGEG